MNIKYISFSFGKWINRERNYNKVYKSYKRVYIKGFIWMKCKSKAIELMQLKEKLIKEKTGLEINF